MGVRQCQRRQQNKCHSLAHGLTCKPDSCWPVRLRESFAQRCLSAIHWQSISIHTTDSCKCLECLAMIDSCVAIV